MTDRRTLQRSESAVRVFAGAASDGHFADHDRHADEKDAEQIDHHESSAAVESGDVGEFPDVAEADGGAGGSEHEAESAAPVFAFNLVHERVRSDNFLSVIE